MLRNRLLLQSVFILFLTGLFGSNALARMNGEAAVLDPWSNVEQVSEAENESTEDSFHPEDLSGTGFDGDDAPEFTNLVGLKDLRGFEKVCACQSASIRQSQINLLRSFHAPAIFILFHSYQGYLS
ncbi:MAG: hypothetical protein JNN28_21895 [Saprospiraceae bacterium]|nr:hypothetical protein [Saprospiraceae bacterium]